MMFFGWPICWSYHGRGRVIVETSKCATVLGRFLGFYVQIDTHHLVRPCGLVNRHEGLFLDAPGITVDVRPLIRARSW